VKQRLIYVIIGRLGDISELRRRHTGRADELFEGAVHIRTRVDVQRKRFWL